MAKADIPDFRLPEPRIVAPVSGKDALGGDVWTRYFDEKTHGIFKRGGLIVDIGGGLRIDASKGDKANPDRQKKFLKYLKEPGVNYKVTDYTDKYAPDFVEDVHALSFADGSVDGLFCLAVLEHVYDPKKAAEELTRVLKPGGHGLLYVPWMYRYHANVTEDYKDYFRYSKDGIAYLFRGCGSVEISPVRGLFETLLRYTPLHSLSPLRFILKLIDWSTARMRVISQRQASGYFIHIVK